MMTEIEITRELKQSCLSIRLGIIQSDIQYQEENNLLWQEIDKLVHQIRDSISQEQIASLPVIRYTRQAYRSLGKEPARYRCSAEALLRRIVKGKDLYRINHVVDLINYISLLFHFSIGCYDLDKIKMPVMFDIGYSEEMYYAIGKGKMNIEKLPVFRDQMGPFGSPTSDSERTMITEKTSKIMIAIIDFNGRGPLEEALEKTGMCLEKYVGAGKLGYCVVV